MDGRETNADSETICRRDGHLLPDHHSMVEGRKDTGRGTDRFQGVADPLNAGGQVLKTGEQAKGRLEEGTQAKTDKVIFRRVNVPENVPGDFEP
jgi:hypothetical protein